MNKGHINSETFVGLHLGMGVKQSSGQHNTEVNVAMHRFESPLIKAKKILPYETQHLWTSSCLCHVNNTLKEACMLGYSRWS